MTYFKILSIILGSWMILGGAWAVFSVEGLKRRQAGHGEGRVAEHFVQQAQGGSARLLDGRVAAGEGELA